jgi:CBS domain-containing protein
MPGDHRYEWQRMYVVNIMSTAIVTATPWLPAARLVELLVDENIGAVPVIDGEGYPLGIVTRADVLEEDELDIADEVTAEELMRRSPLTVEPTTPISEAARLMARQRVHHLLVVDGAGRLVGLLSSFDVVRWVADCESLNLRG